MYLGLLYVSSNWRFVKEVSPLAVRCARLWADGTGKVLWCAVELSILGAELPFRLLGGLSDLA